MSMKQLIAILAGLTLASGLASAGDPKEKKAFSDLDTNRDGYVSQSEAKADQDLVAHFKEADRNRDGFLTPPEFDAIQEETEEAE